MAKTKINITLENDLLEQLDIYCEKNYTNRSTFISQSVNQVLLQQKVADSILNLSIALRKCAELGTLDDETAKKMNEFEALTALFLGKNKR